MKKYIAYAVALFCVVLLAPSCSKEAEQTDIAKGSGTLVMKISGTRTEASDGYDPFDFATIRIFDGRNELIRKYSSISALPASLELLAGDYRIVVDAGDNTKASFTNRTYKGESAFTIAAGETRKVQVECLLVNATVEVKFDKSVSEIFGEVFHAWIMAADTFDQSAADSGDVPALKYTADAKGYFILPEGVTTFACCFEGEHPERGTIVHSQSIENIKPQGKYKLTYKFSPDLPGFITLDLISVDTSEDEEDDTIIFSPDPTLTGVDFDVEKPIRYTEGEKSFVIASTAEITSASLSVNEKTYDLMNGTDEGISVVKNNANSLTLTLSDIFFANQTAGEHSLHFDISDASNGTLATNVALRLQGLLPLKTADYDLWKNELTVRAISFNGSVTFGLRESDGLWQDKEVTSGQDDVYTFTYAPEWDESTNASNLKIYTFKSGTGISAGKHYEYRAVIAETETAASLDLSNTGDIIPGGDMEGNLSCFSTDNTATTTWGSGNNSMAKGLCVKAPASEKIGIGGAQCAKLVASEPLSGYLGAGNLFFATFSFSGFTGPGIVGFGQKYNYTARPKALAFNYHATIGKVTATKYGNKIPMGEQDIATVFVSLIDWSARHRVVAGMQTPEGVWDPEAQTDLNGSGKIIAYAKIDIDKTTEGNSLVPALLPLNFYDTAATAPTGNYTLVISCATSKYGDYMNGCKSNVMYVDDFEWVY